MTTEKTTKDLLATTKDDGLGLLASQLCLQAHYRPPVEITRLLTQAVQSGLLAKLISVGSSQPKQDKPLSDRQLMAAAYWQREQLEAKLGINPNLVAGTSHEDLNAGLKRYRLRDNTGRIEEIAVPLSNDDPQSLPALDSANVVTDERESPRLPALASWRVRDASLSIRDRIEVLREWMADDNDAVALSITQQLMSDDLSAEWRNVLIYATETVRFRDADARTRAVNVLMKQATKLRHSAEPSVSEVVWCAIHRVGSIIHISRANELSVFLGPSRSVDTRLAALQAIVRIFEVAPPEQPADFRELIDPVVNLARVLWNPIVFTVGEISAIAIEATVAAATLTDQRVLELVTLAGEVGRPWVMKKLQKRFHELLGLWSHLPAASPSRMLVQEAMVRASQTAEAR